MKYVLLALVIICLHIVPAEGATFGSVTDTVQDSTANEGFTHARMNSKASGFGAESGSYQHTAGAGETVTSFSIFAQSDGGGNDTIAIALYDITSGDTTLVDSLRCWVGSASATWYTSATGSIAMTSGNTYAIAYGNEVGYVQYYYRTETAAASRAATGALASPWVHDFTSSYATYVYATYEVAATTTGQIIMISGD